MLSSDQFNWAVVITVFGVREVEYAINEVICMVAVGYHFVATVCSVDMGLALAFVDWSAFIWVGLRNFNDAISRSILSGAFNSAIN